MPYLSIREAAEELHSGLITPTELIAETLDRIEQLDGDIKAFITVMGEQALKDAEQAEREMRTGLYRSQLHGIPIAIKDLMAGEGVWCLDSYNGGGRILVHHEWRRCCM